MRNAILAPLLSAFVLPGLGQVINRQVVKGLILMGLSMLLFLCVLVKVLLDLSAVIGQVMGPSLGLGIEDWPRVLEGLRAGDLMLLYVLVALAAMVWAYGVVDAFLVGRRFRPGQTGRG
jgi:hypothetical protein